ncbi:MAG TPA: helix-turn-helix domain-containing protein [bacterium]|nr:helix-turn-helix domain-containing protein [bacterium]HPQ66261.1 helix-turn-helix domain-containing protein [bacterium]
MPDKNADGYPEIMTIEQAASYLQLHPQVVYRHVRRGNLPASRIGSTIRFKKSVIDEWLEDEALKSLRARRAPKRGAHSPFNVEED